MKQNENVRGDLYVLNKFTNNLAACVLPAACLPVRLPVDHVRVLTPVGPGISFSNWFRFLNCIGKLHAPKNRETVKTQ